MLTADIVQTAAEHLDAAIAAAQGGPLLVALSGGGDSTALLHLLRERAPRKHMIAIIVDHGVRASSPQEAHAAQARAEAWGVEARIEWIAWPEGKPRSPELLRRARYQRLARAARDHGARAIAVGHTLDDQAETILMRWARSAQTPCAALLNDAASFAAFAEGLRMRGGAWRGLAGVAPLAPLPLWPEGDGLVLTRPLLKFRREELRGYLRSRGAAWAEDPSNDNVLFERVAVRQALAARADVDVGALSHAAAELRAQAAEEDRAARDWIAKHVTLENGAALVRAQPPPRRALGALIAAIAGEERPPADEAVAQVAVALAAPDFRGRTLGGCRFQLVSGGVRIGRDPGAILGRAGAAAATPRRLAVGESLLWDNRVRIEAFAASDIAPDPGDPDAPQVIAAADQAFSLAEAENAGLVRAQWRIAAHLSHILFTPL